MIAAGASADFVKTGADLSWCRGWQEIHIFLQSSLEKRFLSAYQKYFYPVFVLGFWGHYLSGSYWHGYDTHLSLTIQHFQRDFSISIWRFYFWVRHPQPSQFTFRLKIFNFLRSFHIQSKISMTKSQETIKQSLTANENYENDIAEFCILNRTKTEWISRSRDRQAERSSAWRSLSRSIYNKLTQLTPGGWASGWDWCVYFGWDKLVCLHL